MAEPKHIADSLTKIIPTVLLVTNASTGAPKRLSDTPRKFRSATFIGNNARQTANTGTVYIGWSSVNGEPCVAITTGQIITIEPDPGEAFDLYDMWLDVATASDGVVVILS